MHTTKSEWAYTKETNITNTSFNYMYILQCTKEFYPGVHRGFWDWRGKLQQLALRLRGCFSRSPLREVWGHALPGSFGKVDALRLILSHSRHTSSHSVNVEMLCTCITCEISIWVWKKFGGGGILGLPPCMNTSQEFLIKIYSMKKFTTNAKPQTKEKYLTKYRRPGNFCVYGFLQVLFSPSDDAVKNFTVYN